MSASRNVDGYLICQVRGCEEPARPWSYLLDFDDDLVIEVVVCPRHERDLGGIEIRPEGVTA
jgi:hypothetical protein